MSHLVARSLFFGLYILGLSCTTASVIRREVCHGLQVLRSTPRLGAHCGAWLRDDSHRDLPVGCPLKPLNIPTCGLGNHLGLLLNWGSLGQVLQRPVLGYWEHTNHNGGTLHDFETVWPRLTTVSTRFGAHAFLKRAQYHRLSGMDTVDLPRPLPHPTHSMDLVPEVFYTVMARAHHLRHLRSASNATCITPQEWLRACEGVGRSLRPKVDFGLPPVKSYLVLYLRRGDKGGIDQARQQALLHSVKRVASQLQGAARACATEPEDLRGQVQDLQPPISPLAQRSDPLQSGPPTGNPVPVAAQSSPPPQALRIVVLSDSANERQRMAQHLAALGLLHPFVPAALTPEDTRRLNVSAGEGERAGQALRDFFLMSRAAGVMTSSSDGNPTFAIAAKWNSGGWLPYYAADPGREGNNWELQKYVRQGGFYSGLRSWYFRGAEHGFVCAVRAYLEGSGPDGQEVTPWDQVPES